VVKERCFACNKRLGKNPALVDTRDGQFVFVGSECFRLIKKAGESGYQPAMGGPRLYTLPKGMTQQEIQAARDGAI
jgi:hypothetical protein